MIGLFFIFDILKNSIQATICLVATYVIIHSINRIRKREGRTPLARLGCLGFIVQTIVLTILLFALSQTYWFDRGFGGSAKLPIGYNAIIWDTEAGPFLVFDSFDGFAPSENIQVGSFHQVDHFLCGTDSENYFVVDLETRKVSNFESMSMYNDYASENSLPFANSFKDIRDVYDEYWNGWRFWLLP